MRLRTDVKTAGFVLAGSEPRAEPEGSPGSLARAPNRRCAYSTGVFSSRKVERRLQEDVTPKAKAKAKAKRNFTDPESRHRPSVIAPDRSAVCFAAIGSHPD